MPASAIVSDICSSIGAPWVEMSSAVHQVCRTMGIAESMAIMMMVTANNFAMVPSHYAFAEPLDQLKTAELSHYDHAVFTLP